MRRAALVLLTFPLLAASAIAQVPDPASAPLKAAEAEQHAADVETARLEKLASTARTEADRLRAEQAAAAQAMQAAEARISAANERLQLASAYVAAHRRRLEAEQQPVSDLLAGLATMARQPPLLVLADPQGTDELVKVRLLLDSTLPVIRSRTASLSAQLSQGQRFREAAVAAKAELAKSRDNLVARRQRFAALEQKAVQQALAASGQALSAGDLSIAAGENVERLRGEAATSQSIRAIANQLAAEDSAPQSPFAAEGSALRPPFVYELPVAAPVTEGLAAVNASGVRSRGLAFKTFRGMSVAAPADGTVKYSGPFRDYDGVVIIDHGGRWLTLIVNVASELHPGDRIHRGNPIGRALGPLTVELSQNGRRISPAIIAGSSQNLSKRPKGG